MPSWWPTPTETYAYDAAPTNSNIKPVSIPVIGPAVMKNENTTNQLVNYGGPPATALPMVISGKTGQLHLPSGHTLNDGYVVAANKTQNIGEYFVPIVVKPTTGNKAQLGHSLNSVLVDMKENGLANPGQTPSEILLNENRVNCKVITPPGDCKLRSAESVSANQATLLLCFRNESFVYVRDQYLLKIFMRL